MNRKEDIIEQLPLLVNGQLDEGQAAKLERVIKEDPELQQEEAFLRALQKGFQQQDEPLPGNMGLARLKRDMLKESQGEQDGQGKKKLTASASSEKRVASLPSGKNYWKPVALAACCILALQTVLYPPYQGEDTAQTTDITPLGVDDPITGPAVQMVFESDATAEEIRRALFSVNGTIVGGPGALGVFTVSLPANTDTERAVQQLRAFDFINEVRLR